MNKDNIEIWPLEIARIEHKFSPRLAYYLAYYLPKKSYVYDFGCGLGTYLRYLSAKKYHCTGYEGTKGIKKISDFENIIEADLTKPIQVPHKGSVICLEVAEHIKPENETAFIDNIVNAVDKYLILSWAVPGQGGTGHHNERDSAYVIDLFAKHGFRLGKIKRSTMRHHAGLDLWWFKKSIYFFEKKQA